VLFMFLEAMDMTAVRTCYRTSCAHKLLSLKNLDRGSFKNKH
jgi:hypothetical protein